MQRIAGAMFLSVMAVGLGAAEPAAAQVIASVGADHSSGSYGTGARITTSSAAIGLRVRRKRVSAFASLPVVHVDAPGNVVSTGGLLSLPILIDPARPATRVRRGGVGDAVVGASVQLVEPRRHHVALAVTGSAKLPTASSARGLGTGKADFAVTMEAARPGKVTPFAALGYTVTGQRQLSAGECHDRQRGRGASRRADERGQPLLRSRIARYRDDSRPAGRRGRPGDEPVITPVAGRAGQHRGKPQRAGRERGHADRRPPLEDDPPGLDRERCRSRFHGGESGPGSDDAHRQPRCRALISPAASSGSPAIIACAAFSRAASPEAAWR
jgi:hypothetical protein